MKAIILAAGVGRRLGKGWSERPKILLDFLGRSLLQRHVEALLRVGIDHITVAVGHRAADIEEAISGLDLGATVRTRFNPRYKLGSVVTLWSVRDVFNGGGDVLLLDGDVLYDPRILARLVDSPCSNAFLLDREIEAGEEPVKICVRGAQIVDFGKQVDRPYEFLGESVGFFKFSGETCSKMALSLDGYIERGETEEPYEEVIRDYILGEPPGTFGFEDISGLPWIEIDFPADVARAARDVLPRLEERER